MSEPNTPVMPAVEEFWLTTLVRSVASVTIPLLFGWLISFVQHRKARRKQYAEAAAQLTPPDQSGRTLHQRVQALEESLADTSSSLTSLRMRVDGEARLNDRRHGELMRFLSERLAPGNHQ